MSSTSEPKNLPRVESVGQASIPVISFTYGGPGFLLFEIVRDTWINPQHIVSVRQSSVNSANVEVRLLSGEVIKFASSVLETVKKIEQLSYPKIPGMADNA